jgi:pimeloyl-ACP methyl ester carboxylesterase
VTILKTILALLAVVVAAAVAFLWTPDTDPEAMLAKYGGEEAQFAEGPSGLRVHYRVSGPKDAPVLLFIHGTAASLHTWEPMRERFEGRYRVIAYDQPGHGLTGPHPQDDYRFEGMADGLRAVMDAEGVEGAVLIGNSMGGWVAWQAALAMPERTEGLVLLDASGMPNDVRTDSALGFRIMRSPIGRALAQKLGSRHMVERSLYDTVTVESIIDDAMIDRYHELLRYPGNRGALARQFATKRPDRSGELRTLDIPVLVIWGADDGLIPLTAGRAMAAAIPDAELKIYEGVGHLPMEEAPDRTAADIDAYLSAIGY